MNLTLDVALEVFAAARVGIIMVINGKSYENLSALNFLLALKMRIGKNINSKSAKYFIYYTVWCTFFTANFTSLIRTFKIT